MGSFSVLPVLKEAPAVAEVESAEGRKPGSAAYAVVKEPSVYARLPPPTLRRDGVPRFFPQTRSGPQA